MFTIGVDILTNKFYTAHFRCECHDHNSAQTGSNNKFAYSSNIVFHSALSSCIII